MDTCIRNTDPTAELCRLVMRTMYETVARARPGSPLRDAYDGLGGAFYTVAGQIMAGHAQTSISQDDGLRRATVEVRAAIAAAIVVESVRDVILIWENLSAAAG